MKNTISPEVLALVPNGIENFTPRCTVCAEPLPSRRRSVGHHSGLCHKVFVLHRRYAIGLARCISCLHPSTPEEREQYKRWRRSRGELREKGGRPRKEKHGEQNTGQAKRI